MKDIELLWNRIPTIPASVKNVCPVESLIEGTAFFPGGRGIYMENASEPRSPKNGIMILGHDFDTVQGYERSRDYGQENMNAPTWKNLLELLHVAEVEPTNCFYTNFFMGLRQASSNTGTHPGRTNTEYVRLCRNFLLEQLALLQPRVLLVLGSNVPALIAPMTSALQPWKGATLSSIDRANTALIEDVEFGPGIRPSIAVALAHPSFRWANLWRRNKTTEAGHKYEVDLIQRALQLAPRPKTFAPEPTPITMAAIVSADHATFRRLPKTDD